MFGRKDIEIDLSKITKTEPDELQFVDEDIAEAFKDKCFFTGTPTNLQLARNIKELTIAINKLIEKP